MNDDSELIKVNINFNFNINNKTFLKYVDDINSDKNYLNIYKNDLREYFNNNCDKNAPYFLKKVLDDFKLDENEAEKEKYFFTNYHSAKINNFVIKNNKINIKLSSLKIIFYEISENKEKYGINTKLKFPFEFLSIFYGLNFNDFINFLLSSSCSSNNCVGSSNICSKFDVSFRLNSPSSSFTLVNSLFNSRIRLT